MSNEFKTKYKVIKAKYLKAGQQFWPLDFFPTNSVYVAVGFNPFDSSQIVYVVSDDDITQHALFLPVTSYVEIKES